SDSGLGPVGAGVAETDGATDADDEAVGRAGFFAGALHAPRVRAPRKVTTTTKTKLHRSRFMRMGSWGSARARPHCFQSSAGGFGVVAVGGGGGGGAAAVGAALFVVVALPAAFVPTMDFAVPFPVGPVATLVALALALAVALAVGAVSVGAAAPFVG